MNIILNSRFGKTIVSGLLNKALKRKFDCNLKVKLNDFDMIEDEEGNVRIHLDIDANMRKEELTKIFKEYI